MDSPLVLGGRDGTVPVESKSTETPRLPASVLSGSNKETDARFIRAVRESGGNNPEVQPFDPLPALSNNCSAGVKACVRIKSVLIREVRPDAAKIIARTTNW